MQRRDFLSATSSGIAATTLAASTFQNVLASQDAENVKVAPQLVTVGIMGCNRGRDLMKDLVKLPGVKIKYLCDVDAGRLASTAKEAEVAGQSVTAVSDFRTILDDKDVDALICAAPNHWHGPAAIIGCAAGKHVYVEKPASHNPQEGEWMIAAAKKSNKCVQVGTQRRSAPGCQEAIAKLHNGVIGKPYLARCFYYRRRDSIGTQPVSEPPANFDYNLWQGPAPKRPFKSNIVHYNWHWFWHWGNGELGNNGVHGLDVCRWGLKVDYPTKTVSSGIRAIQDDQETPDTQQVAWEFEGGKQITYQGLSRTGCSPGPFVSFFGTDGMMEIDLDSQYRIFDLRGKLRESGGVKGNGQPEHLQNFLDAVRSDAPSKLTQPILFGHQSTLMCHLGNVSERIGKVIITDPKTGRWNDDSIPNDLWRREYDADWEKLIVS